MNERRLHIITLAIACSIPLLQCAAWIFYSPLMWGMNFLHFLPAPVSIVYLVAFIGAIIAAHRYGEALIRPFAMAVDRRPYLWLGLFTASSIAVVFLLRVKAPLLGDSFILIRNFENTLNGTHTLHLQHEPFALYYFYLVLKFLGISTYPALMDGFLYGEMLLLVIFIVAVFQLSRIVASESSSRTFLFVFLLTQAGMLVFCGYAEIYSVVLTLVAILVLLVRLHLRGSVPLVAVGAAWVLLLLSHVLALVLLPALAYLAWLDLRRSGPRSLVLNTLLLLPVLGLIWVTIGPEFWNLLFADSGSHLLRLSAPLGQYDAYALFSLFHFLDLFNLIVLLAPFAPLLALWNERNFKADEQRHFSRWLTIASGGFGVFLLLTRFDLGMAKDWDVNVAWIFIVSVLTATTIAGNNNHEGTRYRSFAIILIASLFPLSLWLGINATESSSVRRAESLLDSRMLSEGGEYQARYHLASYFKSTTQIDAAVPLWDAFISQYPADVRSYQNLVTFLLRQDQIDTAKVRATYLKWLATDDSSDAPALGYAAFLANSAKAKIATGAPESAMSDMYEAARWDSTNARLRNDFGMMLSDQHRTEEASVQYHKAIAIDSSYGYPYVNLGNQSLNAGNYSQAIILYRKAMEVDPSLSQATFNLGVAFLRARQADSATFYFNRAAAEGNEDARKFVEANQQ